MLATNLLGFNRTNHSLSFTAASSLTRLTLTSHYGNVSHVDNINVQAVPEPTSMAAMAVGATGLLRRRKAKG